MIYAIEFNHFRAFDHVKINGLRRLNIVVGRSASGKTALLEGVRLALGATPQIAFGLNGLRGIPAFFAPNMVSDQFEAVWSSLFFDFDISRPIRFEVVNSEGRSASLLIRFAPEKTFTPNLQQMLSGQPTPTYTVTPIAFERISFDGDETTLYGTINSNGQIQVENGLDLGAVTDFFPSTWQSNSVQVANWFSKLSIEGREVSAKDAIKKQFPEILDLSVQSPAQAPALYATVSHRSRKLPVSLISSGINKFISLLAAIENYKSGVILIDEIENGIYYKILPALWEAIYAFSKQGQTQIFATTHSWECLQGAADLIQRSPADFNLLQVYQESGRSEVAVVPGEDAAQAIEAGIEVRR
jgi:hypothetical protein